MPPKCDIRLQFVLRQAPRDQEWDLRITKIYSTGFSEVVAIIGGVIGRTTKQEYGVEATEENCIE